MNEENKTESAEPQIVAKENIRADKKPSIGGRLLGWVGYLAVIAAILFFFAPESWWQFGVSPANGRKNTPNFSLRKINGEEWSFSEQRGKVVIVNYWATWCPPCRAETPGLVSLADEYKSRGLEVVGVTMDENLTGVPPFVEKYGIKYPVLIPGSDPNLPAGDIMLPTTFLYDKNGRLAKKYVGMVLESTFKSDVETLLSEK